MTEAITIALIASIPSTIAALGAFFVGLRNSKKSDAIHVLVNKNLETVRADLAMALKHIEKLEKLLGIQKQ